MRLSTRSGDNRRVDRLRGILDAARLREPASSNASAKPSGSGATDLRPPPSAPTRTRRSPTETRYNVQRFPSGNVSSRRSCWLCGCYGRALQPSLGAPQGADAQAEDDDRTYSQGASRAFGSGDSGHGGGLYAKSSFFVEVPAAWVAAGAGRTFVSHGGRWPSDCRRRLGWKRSRQDQSAGNGEQRYGSEYHPRLARRPLRRG